MEEILIPLYGACGLLSAILYLPLIRKLLVDPSAWRGHSLASWSGWFAISAVNLAYAYLVNHDAKFIMATLLGCCTLGSVTTIITVRWIRERYSADRFSKVPDLALLVPQGGVGVPSASNDQDAEQVQIAAEA